MIPLRAADVRMLDAGGAERRAGCAVTAACPVRASCVAVRRQADRDAHRYVEGVLCGECVCVRVCVLAGAC